MGAAGTFVCSPCWEEPFGLVVAEALACGTPVAAFDRGALSDVVDERTGVLACCATLRSAHERTVATLG